MYMNPPDSRTRTFEMPRPMGKGLVFVLTLIIVVSFPFVLAALLIGAGIEFVRRFKLP